jgi:hypothetical protein
MALAHDLPDRWLIEVLLCIPVESVHHRGLVWGRRRSFRARKSISDMRQQLIYYELIYHLEWF